MVILKMKIEGGMECAGYFIYRRDFGRIYVIDIFHKLV
jgi:hypothetical protein